MHRGIAAAALLTAGDFVRLVWRWRVLWLQRTCWLAVLHVASHACACFGIVMWTEGDAFSNRLQQSCEDVAGRLAGGVGCLCAAWLDILRCFLQCCLGCWFFLATVASKLLTGTIVKQAPLLGQCRARAVSIAAGCRGAGCEAVPLLQAVSAGSRRLMSCVRLCCTGCGTLEYCQQHCCRFQGTWLCILRCSAQCCWAVVSLAAVASRLLTGTVLQQCQAHAE